MHRSTWKRAEREFAADLGGKRIPVTGERAGADVEHDHFHLQVKVRQKTPSFLFEWLGGIVASARAKSRIGVLVMRRPRGLRKDALVVLRWEDFLKLAKQYGTVKIGVTRIDAVGSEHDPEPFTGER